MAVVVSGNREKLRIAELESLNNQMRWWRWGAFGFNLIFLVGTILVLNNSVRGLSSPGPTQDAFVQDLNSSLQTSTMPNLESEATETLTEIQPEIQTSVLKLKDKVPDLAQASEDQLRLLQQDLPKKGEEILNKRFKSVLTSHEAVIKKVAPDVTEEQLRGLVTNLSDHARAQITQANNDLFGPHQAKIQSILASMDTIRSQESTNVKNEQPDWEMGVLLLDVFRDDLQSLSKSKSAPTSVKQTASLNTHDGGPSNKRGA